MKRIIILIGVINFWIVPFLSAQCLSGDCENGFGLLQNDDGTLYLGGFWYGQYQGLGALSKPNFGYYNLYMGYFSSRPDSGGRITDNFGARGFSTEENRWIFSEDDLFIIGYRDAYYMMRDGQNSPWREYFHQKENQLPQIEELKILIEPFPFFRKQGTYFVSVDYNPQNQIQKNSKENFNEVKNIYVNDLNKWFNNAEHLLSKNTLASANTKNTSLCTFPFSTDIPKLNITFVDNRKKCECCNSALAQYEIKDKNQAILEEEVLYLMEVMENYFNSNKVSTSERDRIQKCMNEYLINKYGAFTFLFGAVGNLDRFLGAGIFSERMATDRKIPLYKVSDFCSKRCENDPRCQD